MAIDFSKVTAWTIPEGNVSQVSVNNVVIWQAAIEAIVSGTDILTLPDAVQSAVVYLKQSGIVSQNGTPTPSSPVDIKCNNGTLTFKDEELPYGYSRIESITFSGSTYYDTSEKLYGSDIVTMTIALSSTGGQNLFGCYSGTDDINFSLYVYGTSSGQAYWRYGTTLYRPTLGGASKRTISFGAGGTTGFSQNVSYSEVEFETTSTARIGALPNSSSPKFSGTIYGNITINSRLKYVPCIRSSDSKIGYYETVKGVFLEPQGSAPTAGAYDYNHLAPYVVGTPEVVTVMNGIADDDITDRIGLDSSTGRTATNNNRCYFSKFVNVRAGDVVTVWSLAQNIGGYLFQYSEPDPQTDTFYEALSMSAYEEYAGGYIRYATATRDCYATFQFLGDWQTIKPNKVSFILSSSAQTASAENLFAVGEYFDEQDIIAGNVTRKVKVYVFNGTEPWTLPGGADYFRLDGMFEDAIPYGSDNPAIVCSHFVGKPSKTSAGNMVDGDIKLGYTSTYNRLYLKYAAMTNADDLKAWFASQAAAGTPVIVVYPLAEPVTESVTPHPLNLVEGDNIVSTSAEVTSIPLAAKYKKKR